jgi:hypothetical protein
VRCERESAAAAVEELTSADRRAAAMRAQIILLKRSAAETKVNERRDRRIRKEQHDIAEANRHAAALLMRAEDAEEEAGILADELDKLRLQMRRRPRPGRETQRSVLLV